VSYQTDECSLWYVYVHMGLDFGELIVLEFGGLRAVGC